jgi:DNA-directed RNA polymerase specialized sigma24 family protein
MLSPLADAPAAPPDEQLVSLAQGGDRHALEQLVARHGPWIFNVAARMVWRRDDAADVTQALDRRALRSQALGIPGDTDRREDGVRSPSIVGI